MQIAITIDGVSKRFPRTNRYRDIFTFWRRQYVSALNGISVQIPKGGVFGLLGPNGAGKTTLLKTLAGLILPDTGVIYVNGVDAFKHQDKVKQHLTYVTGEERTLFWRLTGSQNLRFYAMLNEVPRKGIDRRIQELLALVGLVDFGDERVVKYSTGMKQRLAIARALIMDPDILLLDEPTKSMDPVGARRMWDFVKNDLIEQHRKTVIVATHNMEEATLLCDQVAILNGGRIIACDTVSALAASVSGATNHCLIELSSIPHEAIVSLRDMQGIREVAELERNGREYITLDVIMEEPSEQIPVVVNELVRNGARVMRVEQRKASLGDVITMMASGHR